MKIILALILAILAFDFSLAAVFIPSVLAGIGFIVCGTAIFYLARRKTIVTSAVGWQLGEAVELTNPDRPTTVKNAVIAPQVLNLGLLIIGAPGAGKTVSVLSYLHQLRQHTPRAGWAFFEGKGDTDIYRKAVAMGEAPEYFFSTELPGSQSLNLFAGDAPDVLDRLTKMLIGETTSTSFYSDEQRAVLARIVPLLRRLPIPTNLRDLYVTLTVEDAAREVIHHARAAGADPVEMSLAEQWINRPQGERTKNMQGLLNRLFLFVSGGNTQRLNAYQPEIDIPAIVAGGKSLYLHMPLTDFARDVAIALVETFGVEARKRQLGGTENLESFPLLFDDWGAFFHDNFGPFSARCRSAQMPLNFGFQSRAQLDKVSRHFSNELDDTIATKIYMRVQGEETAANAVRMLGRYETHEVGTSESNSGRDSTSLQSTQRDRIDTRQLRELQPGEFYVSTLQKQGDRIVNPLWKLRIPEPPYTNWQNVPMPAARAHATGEGLNLWDRYLTPANTGNHLDSAAPVEPVSLDRNPGLQEA
jgi:hypothetical protein